MIFESEVKCETCGTFNHVLKHNDLELHLNKSNILEWKCDACGFLNEIEIKAINMDKEFPVSKDKE